MNTSSIPDTDVTAQVHPGAIKGSVFGGHAPVVGAHVYVFQAGASGYASAATAELTTGDGQDSHGYYVLTQSDGTFNITDDYTCTTGHPVYLVAAGGNPSVAATTTTTTTDKLKITAASETNVASGTGSGSTTYTYTITFTGANSLTEGQGVTLSELTKNYTKVDGTYNVVSANSTSFVITYSDTVTGGPDVTGTAKGRGTYTTTTTTTTPAADNPAIANMSVLGNCPGTAGEFASTIPYVYMNEVSTAATVYALGAFGSGPYNIGASSTNLTGIANAATNAGQLFDIQGGNVDSTSDGYGQIARGTTPAGNGVAPQATLDTIGNILAACVDSANTATTASDTCTTLFTYATSNGVANGKKGGTVATDTATAGFNIAHYPAGASASSADFMNNLYALQSSGVAPFAPNLTTQPNDFTVAINYPLSLNPNLGDVQSIAIDGSGNIWATAQTNNILFQWSPVGVPTSLSTTQSYSFGYVSVDPSNDAWTGNADSTSGITEVTSGGTVNDYGSGYNTANTVITNSTGDAYVGSLKSTGGSAPQEQSYLTELSANGTAGTAYNLAATLPAPDDTAHGAIDSAGYLWITSENGNAIDRITPAGVPAPKRADGNKSDFPVDAGEGGATNAINNQPEVPAIDNNNTAWIPLQYGESVDKVTMKGKATILTDTDTGARFVNPFGSAVDGNGNIWIANRNNPTGTGPVTNGGSIVELDGSTANAISPASNYTLGGVLTDSMNLAIDPSGDLWITNYLGNSITEMLGTAAPVVTPLSAAAGAGTLGTEP